VREAHRPRLALTAGDPAGIGPEIVLRALSSGAVDPARLVVYGPAAVLRARAERFQLRSAEALGVPVVDVGLEGELELGTVSAAGGRAAAAAVMAAARDALGGRIDGLVTAPLNKASLAAAGHPWPGHTEMLAEVSGRRDVAMLFAGGPLRVALVTIHRALRTVPDAVTRDEVVRVVRLVHRELPGLGAPAGRIALCALNPHAGEGGMFGTEDRDVLQPAVAALRGEGIDVSGPLAADTVFVKAARGEFDAVVANYHDQGLIPVKLASFGHAVNVTLGLPFVRTSVDHGTAFDIVDDGTADAGSLIAALKMADDLVRRRSR
jgi:4-hydroxythreonine-4-phosphate dehydrogenase